MTTTSFIESMQDYVDNALTEEDAPPEIVIRLRDMMASYGYKLSWRVSACNIFFKRYAISRICKRKP